MKKLLCALAFGLWLSPVSSYESWETELEAFGKASQGLHYLAKSPNLTQFAFKMFDELAKNSSSDHSNINEFRKVVEEATSDGTSLFQLYVIQAQLCDLMDQSRGIPSILNYPTEQALRANRALGDDEVDTTEDSFLFVNINPNSIEDLTYNREQRPFPIVSTQKIPLAIWATSYYQKTPFVLGKIVIADDGICDWAPKSSSVDVTNMNWEDIGCGALNTHLQDPQKFNAFSTLYQSVTSQENAIFKTLDLWALGYLTSYRDLSPTETRDPQDFRPIVSYSRPDFPCHLDPRTLHNIVRFALKQLEVDIKSLSLPFFAMDGTFEAEFQRFKYNDDEFSVESFSRAQFLPHTIESSSPLLSVVDWINTTEHEKNQPIFNEEIPQFIHPDGYFIFGFGLYNRLMELVAQLNLIGLDVNLWDGDRLNGKDLYMTMKGTLEGLLDRHASALLRN